MPRSTIMPAFAANPDEATLLGIILAGYGELEFELMQCLRSILGNVDASIRVLFRTRGEEQRILIADALMRANYDLAGLLNPYSEAIADMGYCRQIRNQYAHCHWLGTSGLLMFANLEQSAKSQTGNTMVRQHQIDKVLLETQEDYFIYVRDCLLHLSHEYRLKQGSIKAHPYPLPKKVPRPPKYNATP